MGEAAKQFVAAIMMDDRLAITVPSRVIRSPSQAGTRPP